MVDYTSFWEKIQDQFNRKIIKNAFNLEIKKGNVIGQNQYLTFSRGKYHLSFDFHVKLDPIVIKIGIKGNETHKDPILLENSREAIKFLVENYKEEILERIPNNERSEKITDYIFWFAKVNLNINLADFLKDTEYQIKVAKWFRNKVDVLKTVVDNYIKKFLDAQENIRLYPF